MESAAVDDLFERWAWLYTLCRERLFTDHTQLISRVMHERFHSVKHPVFMEVGCGPGFYSISLAKQFPNWRILGMDQSAKLLSRARSRAAQTVITNCSFRLGDVTRASDFSEQADLLVASRLLLILPDRPSALRAMYAGVRPGGLLLLAEPLPGLRSKLALGSMGMLRLLGTRNHCLAGNAPATKPLSAEELSSLLETLPWADTQRWSDGRYQYVLCEKPPLIETTPPSFSLTPQANLPTPTVKGSLSAN